MSVYRTPEEIRAANLAAIHRVPEGIRLVTPPPTPTPAPKDPPMESTESPGSFVSRPSLVWPLIVATVIGALLLGFILLLPGCKTITGNPTVADAGHIVANCAEPAIHDIAIHSIDDFTTAIAQTDYNGSVNKVIGDLITQLTGTVGSRAVSEAWQVAKCVIAEIQQKSAVQLGYGHMAHADAVQLQAMNLHAAAWLQAH